MDPISLIGHQYVRKLSVYKGKKFPFTPYTRVALCPFSGPVAIASLKDSTNDKSWLIHILKCDGEPLAQIEASHLYQIFWTMGQKLIVLSNNGRVLVYTASGKSIKTFYMDDKTETLDIVGAKTFNARGAITGLSCLKSTGQLFTVNDVESPLLWRIANVCNPNNIPSVWTVVPSEDGPQMIWYAGRSRFFMAGQGRSPAQAVAEWTLQAAEYLDIIADTTNTTIGLLHTQEGVQVVTSDLRDELYSISLNGVQVQSAKLLWLKEGIVMLQTGRSKVQFSSKEGDAAEFPFSTEVHAQPEIDGLNVFTEAGMDALLPVSMSMRSVMGIASQEPGAFLYEASIKFERKDPVVNDYIQQIGDRLKDAIQDCWLAARESRVDDQEENLFAAALFGQSLRRIAHPGERIEFHQHCTTFRVLRFLKQRGFPLSFAQLETLTTRGIIDRLIEARLFAAADIIAQHTEPTARSRIIAHWALDSMDKVSNGLAEEQKLGEKIIARFRNEKHVSFAETAEVAHQKGLVKLAAKLLDLEQDVTKQVTTLLRLKQQDKALVMCAKSKDPDLIYLVIRHLKGNRNPRELELILQKVPHVFQLYKDLAKDEEPDRLLALYQQSDDFRRQALYFLKTLPDCTLFDIEKLNENLQKTQEALQHGGFNNLANLVQQHKQLVTDNAILEEKYTTSLTDKNLRETFHWAVVNRPQQAEVLKKKYKLSEAQYWYWTVDALATAQLWDRLEHFVKEHKAPMGFLPLMKVLARFEKTAIAAKFMDRLTVREQIRAWAILGDSKKAAGIAIAHNEVELLKQLQLRLPEDSQQRADVDRAINDFNQSRPSTSANQ